MVPLSSFCGSHESDLLKMMLTFSALLHEKKHGACMLLA